MYIDIDSSYRDRTLYPNPSDFIVRFGSPNEIQPCSNQIQLYPSFQYSLENPDMYPYMFQTTDITRIMLDSLASMPLGQANEYYTGDYVEELSTRETRQIQGFQYSTSTLILQTFNVMWAEPQGSNTLIAVSLDGESPSTIYNFYVGKSIQFIQNNITLKIVESKLITPDVFGFIIEGALTFTATHTTTFNVIATQSWYATIDRPFSVSLPDYPAYTELPPSSLQFDIIKIYSSSNAITSVSLSESTDIVFHVEQPTPTSDEYYHNVDVYIMSRLDTSNFFWHQPLYISTSVYSDHANYSAHLVRAVHINPNNSWSIKTISAEKDILYYSVIDTNQYTSVDRLRSNRTKTGFTGQLYVAGEYTCFVWSAVTSSIGHTTSHYLCVQRGDEIATMDSAVNYTQFESGLNTYGASVVVHLFDVVDDVIHIGWTSRQSGSTFAPTTYRFCYSASLSTLFDNVYSFSDQLPMRFSHEFLRNVSFAYIDGHIYSIELDLPESTVRIMRDYEVKLTEIDIGMNQINDWRDFGCTFVKFEDTIYFIYWTYTVLSYTAVSPLGGEAEITRQYIVYSLSATSDLIVFGGETTDGFGVYTLTLKSMIQSSGVQYRIRKNPATYITNNLYSSLLHLPPPIQPPPVPPVPVDIIEYRIDNAFTMYSTDYGNSGHYVFQPGYIQLKYLARKLSPDVRYSVENLTLEGIFHYAIVPTASRDITYNTPNIEGDTIFEDSETIGVYHVPTLFHTTWRITPNLPLVFKATNPRIRVRQLLIPQPPPSIPQTPNRVDTHFQTTGEYISSSTIQFNTDGVFATNVNIICDVLVIGGGGGGGQTYWVEPGGGGGAGGVIYATNVVLPIGIYTVTIGQGGSVATNGQNTTAFGLTAYGGGAGGDFSGGGDGGSGGGGGSNIASFIGGLPMSGTSDGTLTGGTISYYGNAGGNGAGTSLIDISADNHNHIFEYYWPRFGSHFMFWINIPDGSYTIPQLNALIQLEMVSNGHYLVNSEGQNVYYISITEISDPYKIQLDCLPVPSTLPIGWTGPSETIYSLPVYDSTPLCIAFGLGLVSDLGFDIGTYPPSSLVPYGLPYTKVSDFAPRISKNIGGGGGAGGSGDVDIAGEGIYNSITGESIYYAWGGARYAGLPVNNRGFGGATSSSGGSGVVVIRVISIPPIIRIPRLVHAITDGYMWQYNSTTSEVFRIIDYTDTELILDRGMIIDPFKNYTYEFLGGLVYLETPIRPLLFSKCYSISFDHIILPNRLLVEGGQITVYPYVYIRFTSVDHLVGELTTNNPAAQSFTIRVPVSQFTSDASRLPFISLYPNTTVTAYIDMNRPYHVSVHLPNGSVFQTIDTDNPTPDFPNPLLQISLVLKLSV